METAWSMFWWSGEYMYTCIRIFTELAKLSRIFNSDSSPDPFPALQCNVQTLKCLEWEWAWGLGYRYLAASSPGSSLRFSGAG